METNFFLLHTHTHTHTHTHKEEHSEKCDILSFCIENFGITGEIM